MYYFCKILFGYKIKLLLLLSFVVYVLGFKTHLCVLFHQLGEVVEQTVLWFQKIKLVISLQIIEKSYKKNETN